MSQAANNNDFVDNHKQFDQSPVVNFGSMNFESKNSNFLNYEELRISDILKSRIDMLVDELDLLGLYAIKNEFQKYKESNIFNYYNIASYLDTFVSFLTRMKKDINKSSNDLISNRILTINDTFYSHLAFEIKRYMNAKNKFELSKIKGEQRDITSIFTDDSSQSSKRSFFKFW